MASVPPRGAQSLGSRWLPDAVVYHPYLCVEAAASMNLLGWEYGSAPADKTCCPACDELGRSTPRSLSHGKVLHFLNRQGKKWRRDYCATPVPSVVLGSEPQRLPPDRLVDVSYRIVEAVVLLKRRYRCASSAEPVGDDNAGDEDYMAAVGEARDKGYMAAVGEAGDKDNMATVGEAGDEDYMAAAGDVGDKDYTVAVGDAGDEERTASGSSGGRQPGFFVRSGAGWGKTFCLEELMGWINACSDYHGPAGYARHGPDPLLRGRATTAFRDAGVLDFAVNASAYCVNFNGRTGFCDVEERLLTRGIVTAAFFYHARVCYTELVSPRVSWGAYISRVGSALDKGILTADDFAAQALDVMRFCRGIIGGIPILLVDELSKVRPAASMGSALTGLGESPSSHQWAEAVRSLSCKDMQNLGGEVLFTTLEYSIMQRETSKSGRAMLQAFRLTSLDVMGFYQAVRDVLLPLAMYKVGPQSLLDRMVPPGDDYGSDFLKALCVLLGGHPRFVGFFLYELSGAVNTLICEAEEEPIFAADLQGTCWTCLEEAARQCDVAQSLSVYGGVDGFKRVASSVFLRRRVKLQATAVTRTRRGLQQNVSWDEMAADGALQVLSTATRSRRAKSPAASFGIASLHPFALLDLAREGQELDAFCAGLSALLMCPGERLSGERLERFVAQWCVVASHARAERGVFYSSTELAKVLAGTGSAAYVGDGDILNTVQVDASAVRTNGVSCESLRDALLRAGADPKGVLTTVFRLDAGWQPGRQPAADVAEFFMIKEATTQFKEDRLVLVLYQAKESMAGRKASGKVGGATKDWAAIKTIFKELNLWEQWKDRIVYVLVDRHSGTFARAESQVSSEFKAGRRGKQSVAHTGPDLGGWVPEPIIGFLQLAEFLEQAGTKGGLRAFDD
eukprot:contig_22931_g5666